MLTKFLKSSWSKRLLLPSTDRIKNKTSEYLKANNTEDSGAFFQNYPGTTSEDNEAFLDNPYSWIDKYLLFQKMQKFEPHYFTPNHLNDNVKEINSHYFSLWSSIVKNDRFLPIHLLDEKVLQEIISMQETGDLTSPKKPNKGIGEFIRSAIIPIISSLNKKVSHSYPQKPVVLELTLKKDIPLNDVYQLLNAIFKKFPETRVPGSDLVVEIDGKQFTCATILGVVEFDDKINKSHTRIEYSNKTTDKHLLNKGYITFFIEKKGNTFLFYLEGKGEGILPLANEKIGDPLMHFLLGKIKELISDYYN